MGKGGEEDLGNKQSNGSEPLKFDTFPAWGKDVRECEEHFGVSVERGLSRGEVLTRHQIYGLNELEKPEGTSLLKLILEQFNDTLVRILLAAAVVSFVLAFVDGDEGGEMGITAFVEPLVIFLILIVNAIVGIWQETNAEKALEALKEIQSQQATVMRDGVKVSCLPAKELVPGDVVELRVGDKVPADMRVVGLVSSTLRVEQGSLTGESEAVSKTTKAVEENADIQGKKCIVFAGTTVVNGSCVCLVTHTGMSTEIGRVHSQIQEASQHEEDTPLKKKLNEFGEALTMIIGLICALVWLINVKYFLSWEYVDGWPRNFKFSFEKCTYYFEIAVALAVAAIPEGLPAVITTCLALGTRKMAQKNALVRKLPSVETLGCTTVICSDKTGTLTTNQMAVSKLVAMGSRVGTLRSFNVEGTSFDPRDGKIEDWPVGRMDTNLQMIAKIAAICNDANVEQSENQFVARGMPTEAALKVLVEKMGFPEGANKASSLANGDVLRCCRLWSELEQRIATLEFDRDRKSMGVMVDSSSGTKLLLVKGAVENVLERSTHIQLLDGSTQELDQYSRDLILQSLHDMSMSALRCLGFAYSDVPSDFATYDGSEDHPAHQQLLNPINYSSIESNLTFVGFVGLRDPPRKEVRQAIADCRTAGIRVMVITGDNKSTAEAICREIGVFEADEDISTRSLTGKEFMDVKDQKNHLRQSGGLLFSRAEPKHKQEIVRLLKEDGEVVAMTGDGVNDAPALKLADIGVAMGISGTEVIGMYVGVATVGVFIIWYTHSSFMGIDLSQDGHSLVSYSQLAHWGQCSSWEGFKVSPFTAGSQTFSFESNPCEYFHLGKIKASTLSLSVLVAIEMFNSLNALSEDGSLVTMPPWVNPWLLLAMAVSFGLHFVILYVPFLAQVFGIVPLSLNEWLLVLAVSLPVILIDEVLKFVGRLTSGYRYSPRTPSAKQKTE
ncbi:unnamed protein product [Brassica oleracea var. botrytis]